MSQRDIVLAHKEDCLHLFKSYVSNYISDLDLYEQLQRNDIQITSAFRHLIRKKSHDLNFAEMIRCLCRVDNTREQIAYTSEDQLRIRKEEINELENSNNFHKSTESTFDDPNFNKPVYLRAPFGTPFPCSSSLNSETITDLYTALRNVIEGHLDVHEFEKILTQNLNLQLTPIQQKVISRMKYDRSVDFKSLWLAFTQQDSKFHNFTQEEALQSMREIMPQPARSGNIFTWKGCTDKKKVRRKKKIEKTNNKNYNFINWDENYECEIKEMNPRLQEFLASQIEQKEIGVVGVPKYCIKNHQNQNSTTEEHKINNTTTQVPVTIQTTNELPRYSSIFPVENTNGKKSFMEKNTFQSNFDIQWPTKQETPETIIDENIKTRWSKICYDDREPIRESQILKQSEKVVEMQYQCPKSNPPFGTFRDQLNKLQQSSDEIRTLENTLHRMNLQNEVSWNPASN